MAAKDSFQVVKLQRPARATVCSHSPGGHGRQQFAFVHEPSAAVPQLNPAKAVDSSLQGRVFTACELRQALSIVFRRHFYRMNLGPNLDEVPGVNTQLPRFILEPIRQQSAGRRKTLNASGLRGTL